MKFKTLPEIEIDLNKSRVVDHNTGAFKEPIKYGIERLRHIANGNYYNFYRRLKEQEPTYTIELFAESLRKDELLAFFQYVSEIESKLIDDPPLVNDVVDRASKINAVAVIENDYGPLHMSGLVKKEGIIDLSPDLFDNKVGTN